MKSLYWRELGVTRLFTWFFLKPKLKKTREMQGHQMSGWSRVHADGRTRRKIVTFSRISSVFRIYNPHPTFVQSVAIWSNFLTSWCICHPGRVGFQSKAQRQPPLLAPKCSPMHFLRPTTKIPQIYVNCFSYWVNTALWVKAHWE